MAPEIERPEPPYLQIAMFYRERINIGELKDGDRLPSARQMVQQWGVAHATAAKVIATLRAEGLVRTSTGGGGGGGTVVDTRSMQRVPRDRIVASRRWARIYPPNEAARILSASVVEAPDHIAEALGLPHGSSVIQRVRLTLRDGAPVSMSTSWFTSDLGERVPALLLPERLPQGTIAHIEERTGRIAVGGRDQVTASTADPDSERLLNLPAGCPVLRGRNWILDQHGQVIEYGEYIHPAGRWSTYEYRVDA